MTRFGIIGTGRITRRLVADLQSTPSVSVTAIASRQQERADWFASQYGIANAVCGYDELLRRDDVDAVYVSLPPALHATWCVAAARAKKTILCEKPLACNVQQAEEIANACKAEDVRWIDATAYLHHRRTQEMRAIAQRGDLGKIGHVSASVSFYRPFQDGEHRLDKRLGGGCLLDLGWYTVSLACLMAGSVPERVFADHAVVENDVPIRTSATLWFPGHVTATLSFGYDTSTRKWFEVAGSDASLICDDFTRPWADRPSRFWIHDANGSVTSNEISDRQEIRMIETLVGSESLEEYNRLSLLTQRVLSQLDRSAKQSTPVKMTEPTEHNPSSLSESTCE
ncbi:Gfo/Idh/MocA family protein [Roseiconus lacunae]|uniref:Gfo/Idh/MocA family oxidoreductase n=1 Tax=Roseiconus lacunae TaxID=2605694 RepID=A0ABT7PRA1_9BACT|nr:Gfo/Idh/MocA family oxidoreductase [Roseiconus lacunae]MCD0460107.1 Gfo/Idh/MocA family oxidoreductase [Roseiconus lacunae]MDM4018799.1 Gfo/Idh/MocA family oxidoreductase [Roseiconus lacunae]WRQ50572.1 Gfo/Idh/MocA family oxidoreductase [Stieleria sp. HD01]